MSEKATVKRIFDFRLLRRVLHYACSLQKKIFYFCGSGHIIGTFISCTSYLIQITVNDYIKDGVNADGGIKIRMEELVIWITIIQIGLLLVESAIRFYFSYLTAWLGQTVVKDLRVRVYKKILGLNLSQFDTTPIGTLTTRTVDDIERINDVFADGLIPIIADLAFNSSDRFGNVHYRLATCR